MGLCGCDSDHDGIIQLVHGTDHCLAVRVISIVSARADARPRTKFRKEANAADNKGATVAVDSLINFEAVKVIQTSSFFTQRNADRGSSRHSIMKITRLLNTTTRSKLTKGLP